VNNGHITITVDGEMTFVPNKDFTGTVEIPYTVTDGQGGSASSTATITVTPVNDAPVANPDTATTSEDKTIKVDFTGNDSDVDGDHVTVSEINGHTVTPNTAQTIEVKHGHITIAADGEMSFVPNKDFTGTVEIPYTVTDGQGGGASSTATITVTPVNDAPVANPDTATTSEDKTIKVDFAGNDSDVDGDHVTVSQIDGHTVTPGVEQTIKVNHGHITIAADGEMSFVPNKDFTGTVEIPYTVTDGQGGSATSTATITVTPVNDAPVAHNIEITTNEDTPYSLNWASFNIQDTDSNQDQLSIRLTQLPKDGVVQIFTSGQWQNVDSSTVISKAEFDAKQVRFVPELNESSDNSSQQDIGNNAHTYADFTYVVIDGNVQSLPHDVTVKVNAIADPVVVNLTIGEGVYNSDVYKNGHNYTSWKDIVNSHQSDQILTLTPYGDNENLDSDNTHTVVRGLAGADLISAWGDNKDVILIGDDGDLSNNTIGAGSPLQGQLNDTLYGGVGNDILVGESGDDTLYGNKGTDTAVYARNFADYVISQPTITADGGHDLRYQVTDKLTLDEHGNYSNTKAYNGEGRDDLYNIERLQFADGTYYWNGDEWIKEQPTVTYPLDINANLTDTDGSEFISKITLSGLPQGAVLSDENGLVIGTADNNGSITLTGLWKESETSVHIKGLKLQIPAQDTHDVTVKVEAISEEHSNHSTNIGSDDTILDPSNYGYQNISYGDNVVQGNNGNDIIIGDTTGIQITQGENYNIAFILDHSTSMYGNASVLSRGDNIMKALEQIDKVLLSLKSTLEIQGSGHINVALTLFSTVSELDDIDLASYKSGDLVNKYKSTASWQSGGNTNYESAFNTTADWFKSKEISNNHGHNKTYFFTDGEPNYILDHHGHSVPSYDVKNESLNAFHKLVDVSPTVDAIGLLNQVNDAMLKPYDTDGLVHTQIKAEEISDLVLGKETKLTQGADIVSGGEGNDILFGDIIKLDEHSELQGFNALKQYAESQENASHHLTTYDVFKYIQHHIEQFDVSHAGDANDTLNGDQGNDILFGQGGNDILSGGQGNDILLGGFGDDKLHGNAGNDLLIGGSGNDILIGGDGFDTFAWRQSHQASTKDEIDHIKDFNWQEDKLNLSDLLHNISSEQIDDYLTIKQDGKDTVISVANNDHNLDIVLDNVNVHDIKSHLGIITNNLLKSDGEHLILNSHVAEQTAVYEPMVTSHHIIDEHNI
ncbi:TPA: tandem-95 repeat protein, partial [Photobacterium damselae]